jgi:predicted ATPase
MVCLIKPLARRGPCVRVPTLRLSSLNVISTIQIENYKSITNLQLDLGRVNVLIGENGAGKSNILEAIALAGAAAARKLDNEFLASRGIRVVRPMDMRPAFEGRNATDPIQVTATTAEEGRIGFRIVNDNEPYSKWTSLATGPSNMTNARLGETLKFLLSSLKLQGADVAKMAKAKELSDEVEAFIQVLATAPSDVAPSLMETYGLPPLPMASAFFSPEERAVRDSLSAFVTYSPENSALRALYSEGQIEPLGINGEGVAKLYSFYVNEAADSTEANKERAEHARAVLKSLDKSLRMLGWFDGLRIAKQSNEEALEVHDFYIDENDRFFEFGSANEGFFFLLFYFLLFSSELTPRFFAVDNIDASLNPALCRALATELTRLAKENDKQVILTTHNPAILDGLNLDDDEQRLFVVNRNADGETCVRRVLKPKTNEKSPQLKMSEMFMRGLIGGLPKTF